MNWWILLPTVVSIVISIIGYLMQRSITGIDQKIDETNQQISGIYTRMDQADARLEQLIVDVRNEFYKYKDKAADDFVRKTDFIHVTSDICKKLDKVYDILLDLKGRVH